MSSSTSILDLLQSNQQQKEKTQNGLNNAFSPAALFALRTNTTDFLTWGYYGGKLLIDEVIVNVNNGTIQLTDNIKNYIEMNNLTGVLSVNTTGFSNNASTTPIYDATTATGEITIWNDYRTFLKIKSSGTYTLPKATTTILGGVIVDGTTITVDVNGKISSVAGSSVSLGTATPLVDATSGNAGTSVNASREDHVHPLSSVATTTLNGLMSSTDKTKLDGLSSGTSGVSQIIAGTNVTITPTGGTGTVTINAASGGATSLITNEVFGVKSVVGRVVSIFGGRAINIGSTGFYNSSQNIRNIIDVSLTLPASSTGYIVFMNASGGLITNVSIANVYTSVQQPLYYFVTSATGVTTLEDVRKSFTDFNMTNPIQECIQTGWAISSSYSFNIGFSDLNTPSSSWNILPRRIQLYCTTSEFGYLAGHITTAVTNEPMVVVSQGNIKIITQPVLPQVLNRTTLGTISTITPANWKLLLVVEPIM